MIMIKLQNEIAVYKISFSRRVVYLLRVYSITGIESICAKQAMIVLFFPLLCLDFVHILIPVIDSVLDEQ